MHDPNHPDPLERSPSDQPASERRDHHASERPSGQGHLPSEKQGPQEDSASERRGTHERGTQESALERRGTLERGTQDAASERQHDRTDARSDADPDARHAGARHDNAHHAGGSARNRSEREQDAPSLPTNADLHSQWRQPHAIWHAEAGLDGSIVRLRLDAVA
jgi:hypothetical protein